MSFDRSTIPAGHVRVAIQNFTDSPNPSAPQTLDIPLAKGFVIGAEEGKLFKRMFKRLSRRHGGTLAIVGALLLARQLSGQAGMGEEHLPLVIGAISSAVCTSFKAELGTATHNFTTGQNTVKCALYTSSATLGAATTAYSATNEISGTGYTAGGVTIANVTPTTSGTTAIYDWADATWTSSSFTANGCLVYNSSASNKAVFVIAFGSDQTVTSGTFTIQWPAADASNAIIRLT